MTAPNTDNKTTRCYLWQPLQGSPNGTWQQERQEPWLAALALSQHHLRTGEARSDVYSTAPSSR